MFFLLQTMKRSLLFITLLLGCLSINAQRFDNYQPDVSTVSLQQSNLPIVLIETNGNIIARKYAINASMKIVDNGAGNTNYADLSAHPGQSLSYDGRIKLTYRGNSSFTSSAKKPFKIEPINSSGNIEPVAMLGLKAAKEYALLAPFSDRSLLRNKLSLDLARNFMDRVPQSLFCEVVLNGVYYGVYCFTERVASLMDNNDRLFEVDRADEDHYYTSVNKPVSTSGTSLSYANVTYQYKYPTYSEYSNISEANTLLSALEAGLMASTPGADIDVTSFIDYLLNTEFAHNADGYRLSTNIYKVSGGQWKASLWDMDLGFGNYDAFEGFRSDTWVYAQNDILSGMDDPQLVPPYWKKLLQNDAFVTALKTRWQEYRASVFTEANINATIDAMVSNLKDGGALNRNSQAWPRWGQKVWPNYNVPADYDSEISYLKSWISDRLSWMDSNIDAIGGGGGGDSEPTYVQEQLTVTSGFNVDVIDANLSDIASNATGPLDGHSSHFMSANFPGATGANLPADGFINSEGGFGYQLADYLSNNCFYIGINARDSHTLGFPSSGTITFQTNPKATQLAILCVGTNREDYDPDLAFNLKVNYTDGTTDNKGTFKVSNWGSNDKDDLAYRITQRYFHANTVQAFNGQLSEVIADVNKNKQIKSVTITTECQDNAWGFGCLGFFAFTAVKEESATGITPIRPEGNKVVKAIYTLNGQRVNALQRGVNIVRYTDGTAQKVIKK